MRTSEPTAPEVPEPSVLQCEFSCGGVLTCPLTSSCSPSQYPQWSSSKVLFESSLTGQLPQLHGRRGRALFQPLCQGTPARLKWMYVLGTVDRRWNRRAERSLSWRQSVGKGASVQDGRLRVWVALAVRGLGV